MTKYIKFTVGNVAAGYKTIELSIGTKNSSCKILRNGLQGVDNKKARAVEISDEVLAAFDALNIFSWEKDYSGDADNQWELIYKHGKKIYRGHGSAYPENLERFLNWLDKIIPEMQFVNRRRLERVTLNYSRGEIFETLTLDRREKSLTLDKNISKHAYQFGAELDEIFDAAQEFFDNLEVQPAEESDLPKIKIELVRHDSSIDKFDTVYDENYLPGLSKFSDALRYFANDLSAEIFLPVKASDKNRQGKYIFCKVQFKGSYKSYTYRTEDETLAVGDVVDVPVGKNND